jgi:hypothetical protein
MQKLEEFEAEMDEYLEQTKGAKKKPLSFGLFGIKLLQ